MYRDELLIKLIKQSYEKDMDKMRSFDDDSQDQLNTYIKDFEKQLLHKNTMNDEMIDNVCIFNVLSNCMPSYSTHLRKPVQGSPGSFHFLNNLSI